MVGSVDGLCSLPEEFNSNQMHTAVQTADECRFSHYRKRIVNEQTFQPCTIKLVRNFKDGFSVVSARQEMYLGYYYQYCLDTPVRLYACGHAEAVIALNKVGQPAKE